MLFLQVIDVIARVDWTADPKQLVILLFCKNVKTSRTVLLRVHGVKPYFYVQTSGSDHYNTSKAIHKGLVPRIRRLDHDKSVKRTVERAIENGEDEVAADDAGERTKWAIKINEGGWTRTMPFTKYDDTAEDRVCVIERLADISDKTWFPLIGYTDTPLTGIYKISVRVPHLVRIARDVIATGTMKESGLTTDVYNTDLDAAQQFMVDHNIRGGGIFSLDEEILCPTPQNLPASMVETEGIEGLDMQSTDSARSVDVPAADMAPLFETMMSFDIEVAGEPEVFPYANKALYPIIQISASSASTGTSYEDATAGRGVRNIVFCLHETADISEHVPGGAEIQWFDDEYEMNIAFRNHVVHDVDPDIITGWNIEDFDFQYMVTRALVKGWDDLARSWSRLATFATSNYEKTFESSAFGRRESNRTTIPGRIVMDGLEAFRREFKLRSYKLDFVAMHFLKEGKEYVHHTDITPLWKSGDPEKRARLALYCAMDSLLVLRLMILRQLWMQTRSLSDVGKVVGGTTVSRGQSIRVKSMVMHDANIPDDAGAVYLAPYVPHEGDAAWEGPVRPAAEIHADAIAEGEIATKASRARAVGFQGATVIEPKKGYYDEPVATLDFEGLYPSIMRKNNTCYTTWLNKELGEQWMRTRPDDVYKTPIGAYFVKQHVRVGLLPRILTNLTMARKAAKKDMADAKERGDEQARTVYDGRQLALKLSSNSVYGFTGASTSAWPSKDISASVTAYGRLGIDVCVDSTAEFDPGYVVVYGDTDSVMVTMGIARDYPNFNDMPNKEVLKIAIERANILNDFINERFERPINLEFEKVYWPFLLVSKKRYAAIKFLWLGDPGVLNVAGMESTRRDNALLTAATVKAVLEMILLKRDPDGAIAHAKEVIERLIHNKVPHSELVISKAYARADYVGKQPHVDLIARMKQRNVDTYHVSMGDRVPYVICARDQQDTNVLVSSCGKSSAPKASSIASERSEDPAYAAEHNLPIDALYYIQQQLLKPMVRILAPVIGSEDDVIRTLCGSLKYLRSPRYGIEYGRFSPELRGALFGNDSSSNLGMGVKRGKSRTYSERDSASFQSWFKKE